MRVILNSRTMAARRAVDGPGMSSARAKRAWSSRWQKYWARKSSGRQMSWAPSRAARRTRSAAWSRLAAMEGAQAIWMRATRVGVGIRDPYSGEGECEVCLLCEANDVFVAREQSESLNA